jgi:AcrR family transcriptional regulator
VTARRVAAAAGPSTAAVYELFGNKSGLVRSIFSEGFDRLADRLDEIEPTSDPQDDLVALFDATRSFALEHRMLFEVMFARPFVEFEPTEGDHEAAKRIYVHVTGVVSTLLGTRRNAAVAVDAAHVLVRSTAASSHQNSPAFSEVPRATSGAVGALSPTRGAPSTRDATSSRSFLG